MDRASASSANSRHATTASASARMPANASQASRGLDHANSRDASARRAGNQIGAASRTVRTESRPAAFASVSEKTAAWYSCGVCVSVSRQRRAASCHMRCAEATCASSALKSRGSRTMRAATVSTESAALERPFSSSSRAYSLNGAASPGAARTQSRNAALSSSSRCSAVSVRSCTERTTPLRGSWRTAP